MATWEQLFEDMKDEADKAAIVISDRNRKIKVLTAERDNALRRIEELEREIAESRRDPDMESWMGTPQVVVSDWNARGGVNPNA